MNNLKTQVVLAVMTDLLNKGNNNLLEHILIIQTQSGNWEELVDDYAKQIIKILQKEDKPKIAKYGSATTISTQTDEPLTIEVKTPDEFIIYNEENNYGR